MMGRITTIAYEQVKNLGNYETRRIRAEAEVYAEEAGKEHIVLNQLVAFVEKSLNDPKGQIDYLKITREKR